MRQPFTPFLSWCAVLLACVSFVAKGHHSAPVNYDLSRTIEMSGELVEVFIRNPHMLLTLKTVDENGNEMLVDIESIPATRLQRVGIAHDVFRVGDMVRVAGYPSRHFEDQMHANNVLLPDGREVLLDSPVARWTNNTIGLGLDITPGQRSSDRTLGLFRVWSTDGGILGAGEDVEPFLTDRARAQRAEWDPSAADNPFPTCSPKGMPVLMSHPNPIEFVNRETEILMRMEELDADRIVLMSDPPDDPGAPRRLGYSYGRWDGDTLVVETTRIDYPYFSQTGLSQSADMQVTERFTVNEDGSRLDYAVTSSDPWLFTEPFTQTRSWVWVPGDQVRTWECED